MENTHTTDPPAYFDDPGRVCDRCWKLGFVAVRIQDGRCPHRQRETHTPGADLMVPARLGLATLTDTGERIGKPVGTASESANRDRWLATAIWRAAESAARVVEREPATWRPRGSDLQAAHREAGRLATCTAVRAFCAGLPVPDTYRIIREGAQSAFLLDTARQAFRETRKALEARSGLPADASLDALLDGADGEDSSVPVPLMVLATEGTPYGKPVRATGLYGEGNAADGEGNALPPDLLSFLATVAGRKPNAAERAAAFLTIGPDVDYRQVAAAAGVSLDAARNAGKRGFAPRFIGRLAALVGRPVADAESKPWLQSRAIRSARSIGGNTRASGDALGTGPYQSGYDVRPMNGPVTERHGKPRKPVQPRKPYLSRAGWKVGLRRALAARDTRVAVRCATHCTHQTN